MYIKINLWVLNLIQLCVKKCIEPKVICIHRKVIQQSSHVKFSHVCVPFMICWLPGKQWQWPRARSQSSSYQVLCLRSQSWDWTYSQRCASPEYCNTTAEPQVSIGSISYISSLFGHIYRFLIYGHIVCITSVLLIKGLLNVNVLLWLNHETCLCKILFTAITVLPQ